jgi:hypothetical protein
MAIDRLSPTAALIATIRALGSRRGEAGKRVGAERGETASARPDARPDVSTLRRRLVDLVRDEAIDDPETVRRLRPVVVRNLLVWEFGPGLREHPEWQPMLDKIVATLAADPAQQKSFSALLKELKQASAAKP